MVTNDTLSSSSGVFRKHMTASFVAVASSLVNKQTNKKKLDIVLRYNPQDLMYAWLKTLIIFNHNPNLSV